MYIYIWGERDSPQVSGSCVQMRLKVSPIQENRLALTFLILLMLTQLLALFLSSSNGVSRHSYNRRSQSRFRWGKPTSHSSSF